MQQRDSDYDEARPAEGLEAAQRVRMVGTYRRTEGRPQRGAMGHWEGIARVELGRECASVRRGRLPGRRQDGLWSSLDGLKLSYLYARLGL